MTKISHTSLFVLGLLLMAIRLSAASEAEFGKVSKAWTLHADGSQEFRHAQELTLFTHTAMNSTYGESFIVYNPDFQTLKIHASYTKQKDGSIIKTPDNAFVEVLPRFAADAPAYNQLKEMVVVHTGLELGATIYLDYSILTKPGYYPALDVNALLRETSPVKEYQVSVSVPEAQTLAGRLYGANGKQTKTTLDGMKTMSWTLRDVPASSREAFQPENRDASPRLTASTYASGKEALAAMDKRLKESKDYESKTFAQYITENAANEEEKARIIQAHVVNNLGYSAVPMTETGYTFRDADEVLRSAYGTQGEKTYLLNVMLNAAGIPAEIVAVYPGLLDTEACGLGAIKGLTVKATIGGKDRYLSPTSLSPAVLTTRGALDKAYTLSGQPIQIQAMPTILKESKAVTVSADQVKDGFAICTLPTIQTGLDSWNMTTLNSKRSETFELPALIQEEITYTVSPAEGLKLETPTAERSLSNSFGKVTRTITPKGDAYEVVRTIELNKQQFTPAEYSQARELINEWVNPDNRILLFGAVR